MPNVLVRDVPSDVHAALVRRAEASGQSLQQFLLSEFTRLSTTSSLDEVLARIARRRGGRVGFETAVDDLDDERTDR